MWVKQKVRYCTVIKHERRGVSETFYEHQRYLSMMNRCEIGVRTRVAWVWNEDSEIRWELNTCTLPKLKSHHNFDISVAVSGHIQCACMKIRIGSKASSTLGCGKKHSLPSMILCKVKPVFCFNWLQPSVETTYTNRSRWWSTYKTSQTRAIRPRTRYDVLYKIRWFSTINT